MSPPQDPQAHILVTKLAPPPNPTFAAAKRTIKGMRALAQGSMIVGTEWIEMCAKSKRIVMPDEDDTWICRTLFVRSGGGTPANDDIERENGNSRISKRGSDEESKVKKRRRKYRSVESQFYQPPPLSLSGGDDDNDDDDPMGSNSSDKNDGDGEVDTKGFGKMSSDFAFAVACAASLLELERQAFFANDENGSSSGGSMYRKLGLEEKVMRTTLTNGVRIFLAGPYDKKPPSKEVKDLIRDFGGTLLPTKGDTTKHIKATNIVKGSGNSSGVDANNDETPVYIVVDDSDDDKHLGLEGSLLAAVQNSIGDGKNQVRVVSYSWVFDSVSSYKRAPLANKEYEPKAQNARFLWEVGSTIC